MGRASRAKQARRERGEATFSTFCPGMLEVLSIGKGDLKLQIGDSDEDRKKAKDLIEEMLRKGYTIFVETEHYGPVKVTGFIPEEMVYVIADPPPTGAAPEPPRRKSGRKPGQKNRTATLVPVAGSRATAVGRTAGG